MENNQSAEAENLGRRLFENFNEAFDSLAEVREVGTIPCKKKHTNKNPILVENGHIGVESWCVKYLFPYAYKTLMNVLAADTTDGLQEVMKLSRCVTIFCSDCTTAWNCRKHCLTRCSSEKDFQNELDLTQLAIRRHPKSTESFAHRRWILSKIFYPEMKMPLLPFHVQKSCQKCNKPLLHLPKYVNSKEYCEAKWDFIMNELQVCGQAANWHTSNYCAWSHRIWIVTSLVLPQLFQTKLPKCAKVLLSELDTVLKWVELNVSDHSGMSYCKEMLCFLTLTSFYFCNRICSCNNKPQTSHADHDKHQTPYAGLSLDAVVKQWHSVVQCCNDLLLLHKGGHEALWMFKYELVISFEKLFGSVLSLQGCKNFCCEMTAKCTSTGMEYCIKHHIDLVTKFFKTLSFIE